MQILVSSVEAALCHTVGKLHGDLKFRKLYRHVFKPLEDGHAVRNDRRESSRQEGAAATTQMEAVQCRHHHQGYFVENVTLCAYAEAAT